MPTKEYVHLSELTKKVFSVMNPLLNTDLEPIDIIFYKHTLGPGLFRAKLSPETEMLEEDNGWIIILPMFDKYSFEELVSLEYDCAHEVGHYFHVTLNPKHYQRWSEEKKLSDTSEEPTLNDYNFFVLNELVAEIFAFAFFDQTEGLEFFIQNRANLINTRKAELLFYKSQDQNQNIKVLNRILRCSYEEARKIPGVGQILEIEQTRKLYKP